MTRHPRITCIVAVSIVSFASSIFAQRADDPFQHSEKNPFQRETPIDVPAVEIDTSTLRQCFRLVGFGLQVSSLQGKRMVAEDESRLCQQRGDRDGQAAAESKIQRLAQEIQKSQQRVDKQLQLAVFDMLGRAEFDAHFKALQQHEIAAIANTERLKIKMRLLAEENKQLRQQLADLKRGN